MKQTKQKQKWKPPKIENKNGKNKKMDIKQGEK